MGKKGSVSLALVAGLLVSLAGCASADEPVETNQQPDEFISNYFNSLASGDPAQQILATEYALADSAAQRHVNQFISDMDIIVSEGIALSPELEVVYREEEVLLCFEGHDAPAASAEDFCFVYSDIASEGQLVTDFEVAGQAREGQVALRYFSALAGVQPETKSEAKNFAASGSLAEQYAAAQAIITQAQLDGGSLDTRPHDVLFEDGVISLCERGYKNPNADRRDFCTDYANFIFEGNKIVNFDAGDRALDGRILLGGGPEASFGGQANMTRLLSFESSNGHLVIVVEFTSTTGNFEMPYLATYVGDSGRPVEMAFTYGPRQLKADRTANLAFFFAGAAPGGSVELLGYDNFSWREIEASIDAY